MNKREQQKETTINEILEVSETLFRETGYAKTTIQNIADRCGLSKGALYHHFKSKEEVLEKICEKQYMMMKQMFTPIVGEDGPSMMEKLKSIMTIARQSSMNTAAVTFAEPSEKPSLSAENAAMEKLFDYYSERLYIELFSPLLEEGRKSGECSFSVSSGTIALFIHHLDSGMTGELQRILTTAADDADAALADLINGFSYTLSKILNVPETKIAEITLADEMLRNYTQILHDRRTL